MNLHLTGQHLVITPAIRDYVIANVAAGLSLASAAGAVVTYFLLRPKRQDVPNVALHVDQDGATLGYNGRF